MEHFIIYRVERIGIFRIGNLGVNSTKPIRDLGLVILIIFLIERVNKNNKNDLYYYLKSEEKAVYIGLSRNNITPISGVTI